MTRAKPPTATDPTKLRLQLLAAGFLPIPVEGKRPPMDGWQNKRTNADEIRLWEKVYPLATNMGILGETAPGLDVDVYDEDAAETLDKLAREFFEERGGKFSPRIGLWPKRLIPLRTDEPFTKLALARAFVGPEYVKPDGTRSNRHKIEILCQGQQWVCDGIHPDTQAPYRWTYGAPGTDFAREDLPYVRREDVEQFLDAATTLLIEQHGFTLVTPLSDANGGERTPGEPLAPASRIAAAVAVIPNNDVEWDEWNRIGMAIWRATDGSGEGFGIFDGWSQRSRKHNTTTTGKKWSEYTRSPPTQIGAGTIIFLADQADATWREKLQGEPPQPEPDDPGAQPPPERKPDNAGAQPREATADDDDTSLPYVDLARDPIPPREWLVHERIPLRNVTSLSGEGAIGKSILLMQLSGAVALGLHWISTMPAQGAVLYMSCEEDDDEVQRRMQAVAQHLDTTRQEMVERGLRFLSFAGRDAILAQPDRFGIMRPTPLFDQLRRDALQQRPKLIVLDNVADIFGGKEMDRAQTRQFITMLRGLAMAADSAVVISAHPSLTGITTDTGLSGSTGWHNSVRARMYFKPAPGDDTALRVLEVKKSNYGPVSENILLRWRDGVYVVEPGVGSLDRLAAEAKLDQLFLILLRRFTKHGRRVSDKKSPTHAPAVFADEPEAKKAKADRKALAEAMVRLFEANKLRVVTIGSASRMRGHIVEGGDDEREPATVIPFPTALPTAFQPPSNRGAHTHPPYPPSRLEAGKGAVGSPPASNGPEAEPSSADTDADFGPATFSIMGIELDGTPCLHCGKSDGNVYMVRDDRRLDQPSKPLHERCARKWFTSGGGRS
jgi:RecA-family ATPase